MKQPTKVLATRDNIKSASQLKQKLLKTFLSASDIQERDTLVKEIGELKIKGTEAYGVAERSWIEISERVKKLKDKKLHRDTHDTFKSFCEDTLGFTEQWVYSMLKAAESVSKLRSKTKLQFSKKAALALAAAPEEKQEEIAESVVKSGKVTEKSVKKAIADSKRKSEKTEENSSNKTSEEAEFREVIKDANGDEIPEWVVTEFLRAEKDGKENTQRAQEIKNWLERDDLTTIESRGLRETVKDLLAGIKQHQTKHVLCPKCSGKKCAVCSKRGFVSKYFATKGIGKPTV